MVQLLHVQHTMSSWGEKQWTDQEKSYCVKQELQNHLHDNDLDLHCKDQHMYY